MIRGRYSGLPKSVKWIDLYAGFLHILGSLVRTACRIEQGGKWPLAMPGKSLYIKNAHGQEYKE